MKSNLSILVIMQWTKHKNAEYELIEKLKYAPVSICIVDYLGFEVNTGICINDAECLRKFDFAISFHYDTPKFINIPTYLWVANPLEFLYLRHDYSTHIMHRLRSYDNFVYNRSDFLKEHIKRVIGKEWSDSCLEFFASAASEQMLENNLPEKQIQKLFYCGINWERSIDKSGRSQGILDLLEQKHITDFYGPEKLGDVNPWEGIASYRGEIPFDGVSLSKKMQEYAAVLATSSPAHIKSGTSSSRVFEAFIAGVPVISDENEHVKKLFGDLVYYFQGGSSEENVLSIEREFNKIINNPEDARERVKKAQKLISEQYCFDKCLSLIQEFNKQQISKTNAFYKQELVYDVFLFYHDSIPSRNGYDFENINYIIMAAEIAINKYGIQFRIVLSNSGDSGKNYKSLALPKGITLEFLDVGPISSFRWKKLKLGEKVALLNEYKTGQIVSFITQFDFLHYDYFNKVLSWISEDIANLDKLYISGFYANDLSKVVLSSANEIIANNLSISMYEWSQESLAEHQLGSIVFTEKLLNKINLSNFANFDVCLPVVIILEASRINLEIYRSRYITLRVQYNYFLRHYSEYLQIVARGFWAQHYEMISNYNHELNMLYDYFHESAEVIGIIREIRGDKKQGNVIVDPAIYKVNQFIDKLRPTYRFLKKFNFKHIFMRK